MISAVRIPETRQCQIAYMRDLIRMAADLRVPVMRVFLAWPGVTQHPQLARYDIARGLWKTIHESFTQEETWNRCREGLTECARYAADAGVTLALENHAPVIQDHHDVLRMVQEVGSPSLKVCLDVPIMPDKSPAVIQAAARAVGRMQVLSHFGGEYTRRADGSIAGEAYYPHFIEAMKGDRLRRLSQLRIVPPAALFQGQTVGIEYADKNARLAAEYMCGVGWVEIRKIDFRTRR